MGWQLGTSVREESPQAPGLCSSQPAFSRSARSSRSSRSRWRFSTLSAGSVAQDGGNLSSPHQVVGGRDLDVVWFAFDHDDIASGPFDDGGRIGADEALTSGPVVRFEQPGGLEDLRRLHRPEVGRVAGNPATFGEDRRRGNPEAGDASDRLSQSGQKALDESLAGKRPYRIVDQYGVDPPSVDVSGKRLDTGKFGSVTDVAAAHTPAKLGKAAFQRFARRDLDSASHQHNFGHLRRRLEEGERPLEYRGALDFDAHLVLSRLHASAFAARHDHGRRGHSGINTRARRRAARHSSMRFLMSGPSPTRSRA